MDFFRNHTHLVTRIVIALAAFLVLNPSVTLANQQEAVGEFARVQPDKDVYLPTVPRVIINLDIHNSDFRAHSYQVGIEIIGPSGALVFERVSTQERDIGMITVDPGATDTVSFSWEDKDDGTQGITRKSAAGIYTVTAKLRDWNDFDLILDEVTDADGITFEVQARPFLEVSRDSLDFGTFLPGDTPERSFSVTNSGNGTLEWHVDLWPESWLQLVEPTSSITGQATVRFRVRPDAQLSEPFIGSIRVTSNVGEAEISAAGALSGNPSGLFSGIVATRLAYRQGETVNFEYEIENDGGVPLDYRLNIVVQAPDESIVFDTLAEGEEIAVFLQPNERRVMTYEWPVPILLPAGNYLATIGMRYVHDPNLIFHDYFDQAFIPNASHPLVSNTFTVQDGPLMSLSDDNWDFGSLDLGEAAEADFEVTNTRQGTLSWEITGLPDWLELTSPQRSMTGDGSISIAVKGSLDPGSYDGEIQISSNGGDSAISVSLNIAQPITPTPTPEPTATAAPATATPIPATPTEVREDTATPVPPTATPPPTSTPVPATSTPAPTSTPVPPTATATAQPSPTSAPTSTPPPAQAVAATPAQGETSAEDEPESSGGCGSAQANLSPMTATANVMFFLAPIGLLMIRRRFGKRI